VDSRCRSRRGAPRSGESQPASSCRRRRPSVLDQVGDHARPLPSSGTPGRRRARRARLLRNPR
jgi:hypothetical protein